MLFDLQKIMKVGMIPAAALVGIAVVSQVMLRLVPFLACIVGLPLTLVNLVLLAWVGFKAVKEEGMTLVDAAIAGAVVGAVTSLISAIVSFAFLMLGGALGGSDAIDTAITGTIGIVGILLAPVVGAVMGAILSAIGAFVAGMKK
ncbi:hypothetical protein HY990_05545 [Candidatus Micrarchaeota archaeon]|nr:hypothetical protein [Candidatus Micrarchaeota archaeon]